MNEFNFQSHPSELCKVICVNNISVYLDLVLLCSHVYSIMISYTIAGKHITLYDNNGKRIQSHLLPISVVKISYYQSYNTIYFNSTN